MHRLRFFGMVVVASAMSACANGAGESRLPDAYFAWVDVGRDAWLEGADVAVEVIPDGGPDRACIAEVCDNGVDDDCDGVVDDHCTCEIGSTAACFRGNPAHRHQGLCTDGAMRCEGTEFGLYTACEGGVIEQMEVCDAANQDEDCDGMVNEGCGCTGMPDLPCGTDVGECAPGVQRCVDGMRTACEGAVGPSDETCDGQDDDCDTRVDEGGVCPSCTMPAVPAATLCGTSWDRRPIVEFPPLPSGIVYELFLDGAATPYGTVTTVGQNYFRPAAALTAGGPVPGTRASIVLRACRVEDRACCASSAPAFVNMIESCTTPIAPSADNLVFSEYVIDGDGTCPDATSCEAGETIEITNLSNCPVSLAGNHFSYCNGTCASGAYRWMNFTSVDVIPPRGVYVAIRNRAASMCSYPFFGPDDPGLFGLRVSTLAMEGPSLASGWFSNTGGAMSQLRIATGAWSTPTSGTTLERIAPYLTMAPMCGSIGFDAVNKCGEVMTGAEPTEVLTMNQLGRLWHPCDAVVAPMPMGCR